MFCIDEVHTGEQRYQCHPIERREEMNMHDIKALNHLLQNEDILQVVWVGAVHGYDLHTCFSYLL